MRQQIKDLEEVIDLLLDKKKQYVRQYIEEETNYLYITDHAMVRYLERVENILLIGETDQEKLLSYNQYEVDKLRRNFISKEEQKRILYNSIHNYNMGNGVFAVIKGLAVVTVVKRK